MKFQRISSIAFHFMPFKSIHSFYLGTIRSYIWNEKRFCGNFSISSISSPSSISTIEPSRQQRIAVIGGGASGMFAATAAADAIQRICNKDNKQRMKYEVIVLEGTSHTLSKVRISGGGRCNVMHDRTKSLPDILSSYPRGNKELRGLYTKRFTPNDAYNWFTKRGVKLKTESDGRMFPDTDNSQTIIDTILNAATQSGVTLRTKEKVEGVERHDQSNTTGTKSGFIIHTSSKSSQQERINKKEFVDAIILATGFFPIGHEIARSLGHTIVKPVPSLFTFDAKDLTKEGGAFHGLAGVSVPTVRLTLVVNEHTQFESEEDPTLPSTTIMKSDQVRSSKTKQKKLPVIVQEGPLLITHHGISGPATLRLSAFAAREFHALGYNCEVKIHFCPKWEEEQRQLLRSGSNTETILMDALWKMTRLTPRRRVSTGCPLFMEDCKDNSIPYSDDKTVVPVIPKRLWSAIVQYSQIPPDVTWGDTSKSMIRSLSAAISSFSLTVTSKGIFKEEFVTAGGVHLKEIQMSSMESKLVPGLFMCGEVLDIDGVTGGFNFMGCWSTGFLAGEGAAEFCCREDAK